MSSNTAIFVRRRTLLAAAAALAFVLSSAGAASAASPLAPDLGQAASFAVLGAQAVTSTGPTVINGDLGVSPGSSITGFPPGLLNGGLHFTDALAASAQADLVVAYDSASAATPEVGDFSVLDGRTLIGGTYAGGEMSLPVGGTLTLDGEGATDSVWIFQASSSLVINSGSVISLTNGASPCNIFWQVTSDATIGTNVNFSGTVLALTSITARTGAVIDGRLLARNAAVTLDSNVISSSDCAPTTADGPLPTGVTTTTVGTTTTGIFGPGATPPVPGEEEEEEDSDGNGGAGADDGGDGAGAGVTDAAVPELARTGVESEIAALSVASAALLGVLLVLSSRRAAAKPHRATSRR